jgi:LytS/YehU family sensor histidine kinase
LILAYGIGIGIAAAILQMSPHIFWQGLTFEDADLIWKVIILLLIFIFIYNVIYALLYSYQHYAVAQIENLQNERKQLELQFQALKGQLSPHYLFNSLNTISSLLYKDVQSAEQFIRRLVQTYQYILATQNKKYVLLGDELDFVRSYYYLLRIRFEQQLTLEINLPSNMLKSKIPPLTIQILVENAVKHNMVTNDKSLFIYITGHDSTYIKVVNTKTAVLSGHESFKVGLENIRKRYAYITDKKIIISDDDKFSVSLPVIYNSDDKDSMN